MNFIKQIFKGDVDEKTHQKFIKYGKGQFPGPVIEIKKDNKAIKVNGSFDYSDVFGRLIAENTKGVFNVTGNIISKNKLEDELSGLNVKIQKTSKKGKLKVYQIKTEIDSRTLKKLYELDAYVLLSLTPAEKSSLKLKSKPSPPKPGGGGVDENFCSATFDISMLEKVMDELCFDFDAKNFKKINISHIYRINELIIPEGLKDPVEIRIRAKRKGKIIRKIIVDDKDIVKEGDLLA